MFYSNGQKHGNRLIYFYNFFLCYLGNYLTKVSQLLVGGLMAEYFDNQYLYGSPVLEQLSPTVNYDFGLGLVTTDASQYVSIRFSGKLLVPKTDAYTFYLTADDSANLAVNHTMIINSSAVCCIEHRAVMMLYQGEYVDIILEYQQLTGAASISLSWSSSSMNKVIIPSSSLFYSTDIVGSPYTTLVVPGAADYPYTNAFGSGLSSATAGSIGVFYIQTKDALGNNKTTEYEHVDPNDLLSVMLSGSNGVAYYGELEYIGQGMFQASYIALKSGTFLVTIKMGGYDIYCGLGESNKCSPFTLVVAPGVTVASMCEAGIH